MEPDHISENSDTSYEANYCSVAETMKLLIRSTEIRLWKFIENDVAFELVHPNKHDILLSL